MVLALCIVAAIMIVCVFFNKISHKIGMPILFFFIVLGMIMGSDGLFKIPFDNYDFAEKICSVALIFIMFYGGFGTKWSAAKPIATKAILLSSLGTVLTAGFVGLFCHFVLRIEILESFLIGAVICSTDAASVFSILRSKRLNLRFNTASMLEVESGSNDPFSYMLTVIILSLMGGDVSAGGFAYMLFAQIVYGAAFGFGISFLTVLFLKKFHFSSSGFYAIFVVAIALLAYAAPALLGGNGYLSTYIAGIVIGNAKIKNKRELVDFFDGTNGLMQMVLFFLLGLLSFPSKLPGIALTAFLIALFLTFIARPLAVFTILSPFKSNFRQQLLVSWAGMRGAASIVFAIMVVMSPAVLSNDIFHIVFFIVLFSILIQGTLLPLFAKKLKLTDNDSDVMKTFTDYIDETPLQFIQFSLPPTHHWIGKSIREIMLPPDTLLVLILRGKQKIIPAGKTILFENDTLILSGTATFEGEQIKLYEREIDSENDWIGKKLSEISPTEDFIVFIKRGDKVIIPKGNTVFSANDRLVILDKEGIGPVTNEETSPASPEC